VKESEALFKQLREQDPAKEVDLMESISGATGKILTDENIQSNVQEFIQYLPPDKVAKLSKLKITVGVLDWALGDYRGNGHIALDPFKLKTEIQAKRTTFHELMHLCHLEGSGDFRAAIREHFFNRTKGKKRSSGWLRQRGRVELGSSGDAEQDKKLASVSCPEEVVARK